MKEWMETFKVTDCTRAVRRRDATALITAFLWRLTPEGEDYWSDKYESGIDDEAYSRLCGMIEEYDAYVNRSVRPYRNEDAPKKSHKSYVVWDFSERAPMEFGTLEGAKYGARELALKDPGKRYIVLESIAECCVGEVTWTEHQDATF